MKIFILLIGLLVFINLYFKWDYNTIQGYIVEKHRIFNQKGEIEYWVQMYNPDSKKSRGLYDFRTFKVDRERYRLPLYSPINHQTTELNNHSITRIIGSLVILLLICACYQTFREYNLEIDFLLDRQNEDNEVEDINEVI